MRPSGLNFIESGDPDRKKGRTFTLRFVLDL